MKKLMAFLLALTMLAACLPAYAVRPIVPPGDGGITGGFDGDDCVSTVPQPSEAPVRPHPEVILPFNPDADYDGIPDYADSAAKTNTFASTVRHKKPVDDLDASYPYTYTWDYSRLFDDLTRFDEELCRLSSLIAGLGYHRNSSDSANASDDQYFITNSLGTAMTLPQLMAAHGMQVEEHNLNSYYGDHHLTLVDLGIHRVVYGGKEYDVVLIAMRGSNGTWEEWNSNFEIGHDLANCEPEFMQYRFGTAAGWTNRYNHMGFDITANRVLALAEAFVQANSTAPDGVVYWVTGHSRGGAIANLTAAKLLDMGKRTVAYTFACPNATLAGGSQGYESIFNAVNEDDLVPYLPFTSWGYGRYGRTAVIDMSEAMRAEWKSMVGKKYDHAETTLTNALEKLQAIASCRNDAYTYTCSCHGNGTDDDIKTSNWYFTQSNREKGIAKTPACLTGYYKLELEDATFYWTHHCQPPIFFMQYLACYMAGQMTTLEFGDYDVADKYETAKWSLAAAAVWGVGHPHFCESYFIIADHLSEWVFN